MGATANNSMISSDLSEESYVDPVEASSGCQLRYDANESTGSRTFFQLARMQREFGQDPTPGVLFEGRFKVRASDWLPQGQSAQDKRSLDDEARERNRRKPDDLCSVSLHWWPKQPSRYRMESSFFVMKLDNQRVMDAINATEMDTFAVTRFLEFLVQAFKSFPLPTPKDYKLVGNLGPPFVLVSEVYPVDGDTRRINQFFVHIMQDIQGININNSNVANNMDVFAHVFEFFWFAEQAKLLVVGRGEAWPALQHFTCSKFSFEFARKILSKRSRRKNAQLELLESQVFVFPSRMHVKGFIDPNCDFHKHLLSLERFELCNMYHYEDPDIVTPNDDNVLLSDSLSDDEESLFSDMHGLPSHLATLPIKIGVGHGIVKICLALQSHDYAHVADYIMTMMD